MQPIKQVIKLPGILPTDLSFGKTLDTANYTKLPVIEDTIAKSIIIYSHLSVKQLMGISKMLEYFLNIPTVSKLRTNLIPGINTVCLILPHYYLLTSRKLSTLYQLPVTTPHVINT